MIKTLRHCISLHGIPKQIVSDQGSEFTSSIFCDFCKQYDIDHHITSFQQSSSNAPVERFHSTLTEIYRIVREKQKGIDHDDILNESITTYNNAIHSSTEHTPFELFYGRTHVFNKTIKYDNIHEYLRKLNAFQESLYPTIKKRLEEKVKKNIEKLNINRETPQQLKENDIIYRKEFRRNKLTPRFTKHKIKENNKVSIITHKLKKLHKSKIKKKRKFQDHSDDRPKTTDQGLSTTKTTDNGTGSSKDDNGTP